MAINSDTIATELSAASKPYQTEKMTTTSLKNAQLKMDILKAFGADFNTDTRENLVFVNNVIVYPCGRHLCIRDILNQAEIDVNKTNQNDQLFIFMEDSVKQITCLNVSNDGLLLMVCTENVNHCEINVYNMSKINFGTFQIFRPKRKLMTSNFKKFKYAGFSEDGNLVIAIAENKIESSNINSNGSNSQMSPTNNSSPSYCGVVYDIQENKKFRMENYTPKFTFEIPKEATKISFLDNKTFCISGKNYLCFMNSYETMAKELKSPAVVTKNYVDHAWIKGQKSFLLAALTQTNEIYFFTPIYVKNIMEKKNSEEEKNLQIERFSIKETLTNIFNMDMDKINLKQGYYTSLCSTRLIVCNEGLIVGSNKGNILFIEKLNNDEYFPIRYTMREKEGLVTGLTIPNIYNNPNSPTSTEEYLAVSFITNEIAYVNIKNIFSDLKNPKFELKFNIVCDGFHSGAITSMDVALQRPIIITSSREDKTVRIWNYLTGHCEYCKIILEQKEGGDEKEINILSVAIHPNGYYIAISDPEMIRFFHLCYKELRFYGNDQIGSEPNKQNCTLLKFSYGGHLLAAVSERKIYVIRSLSRETLKVFDAQHTGKIVNIFFHPDDSFLYSCGTEGFIVQYNLYDFTQIKISYRFNIYSDSFICKNVRKLNKLQQVIPQMDNIISIGSNPNGNFFLTNLCLESSKIEEASQCKYTEGFIDEDAYKGTFIMTQKFSIKSVAVGTDTGKVCLYSTDIRNEQENPKEEYKNITKFDGLYSHRKKVNFLYFSSETNLLFSAGEDGNLFIYAIYEYPDGENLSFEENKAATNNQISTLLDEGLGENVLLNISEIIHSNELNWKKQEEIYKLQKIIDESSKLHERQTKEKINELNKQREMEVGQLKRKIDEMVISQNTLIDDYEKKIVENNGEHRKKFNEREIVINEKIEELNKQIADLKELNDTMKKDFEEILKVNNDEQLAKFKELESVLQKHVQTLVDKNKKLEKEIKISGLMEEKKIGIIEVEHENEIHDQIVKFNEIVEKNHKEIDEKMLIISKLNDKISKLEKTLNTNENNLKNYIEDKERLTEAVTKLKQQLESKEREQESLTNKLNELEQNYQEKSKLENFSNKLKNALYTKNYELNSKFNNEVIIREEMKDEKRNLEKQLEDSINLLMTKEMDISKQKILIEEQKKKIEQQRKETGLIKKDLDNLLRKIYDVFQTNNKNEIIRGIREIYNCYLSKDAKTHFDSNKLNVNIRIELEKHIEHLQKELTNKTDNNLKRENTQVIEYQRKMQENSILIEEMTRIKKFNASLEEEIKTLKYKNIMQNININKLKDTIKEYKNIAENSKIIKNETSKGQNNNSIYDSSALNFNSSSSTSPSEILPILNSNTKLNAGSLKNMRNRVFKPGQNFNLSNDKMMKFKEMKRIIEGKNDIIQKLTCENEFLRRFNYNASTISNNNSHFNSNSSNINNINNNSNINSNSNIVNNNNKTDTYKSKSPQYSTFNNSVEDVQS